MISDLSKASLVAEIIFISPKLGGRNVSPPKSGYRGQFFYNETDCDAIHVFDVETTVPFGEVVKDYVFLVNPVHVNRVSLGMPVLIREGTNTVAYGRVIQINTAAGSANERRREYPRPQPGEEMPRDAEIQESKSALVNPQEEVYESEVSDKTEVVAYWQEWHRAD